MSSSNNFTNSSLELAFDSSINGVSVEALNTTKTSLKQLIGQKNAYICRPNGPLIQAWNMITYRKDCKSSL